MPLHLHRHVDNIIHHLLPVLLIVRWPTAQHFIEEGTKTPPICGFAMANALDDLWGKILGSSAVRVSASAGFVRLQPLLRQAEVCYLDVALVVQ